MVAGVCDIANPVTKGIDTMARSGRLLALVQELRAHRHPVTAARLAEVLEVSVRTIYRDIATLQEQGAVIEGEAGIGYQLRDGYLLPPLMFSDDELDALVLGMRWVAARTDPHLRGASIAALSKIAAVLPAGWGDLRESRTLFVGGRGGRAPGPQAPPPADPAIMICLRRGLRQERILDLTYRDASGAETRRRIWPFVLGYFDAAEVIGAWCEDRQAFRHFRTDRILAVAETPERMPRRRAVLLKEWSEAEGISLDMLDPPDRN